MLLPILITKGLVTNGGIDRLRKVIGGSCIADNLLSCAREGEIGGGSFCCFSFGQDRESQFQYFLSPPPSPPPPLPPAVFTMNVAS